MFVLSGQVLSRMNPWSRWVRPSAKPQGAYTEMVEFLPNKPAISLPTIDSTVNTRPNNNDDV